MNNILIQGLVDRFLTDYCLEFDNEPDAFETFSNYCIISEHDPNFLESDMTAFESINVDNGHNMGIDGAALFINNYFIKNQESLDYFLQEKKISASLVFVQSKTSSTLNLGDFNNFCLAVSTVIKEKEPSFAKKELCDFIKMIDDLYSNSAKFKNNPSLRLAFVYCGVYSGDPHIVTTIEKYKKEFYETGLFSEITIDIIDSQRLSQIYRQINNNYTASIVFELHKALPKIKNVHSSYIGVIKANEFVKLLVDENGSGLRQSIFYENVRDFQGDNAVNLEMEETINNMDNQDEFVLLNNGITIVTRDLKVTGSDFALTDYQIVNGCQTSNIIFRNRSIISDALYLPLKLIFTEDNRLTNSITKSTNRQTAIVDEAFEAMGVFHQNLESFYNTLSSKNTIKIYYERRSRQYASAPEILRSSIITLHSLIRSYTAMFLNEPHSTHRYPGEILKSYKSKLFKEKHSYYAYYISSLTFYKLEKLIGCNAISPLFKKYRYHIIYIIKLFFLNKDFSPEGRLSEKQLISMLNYILDEHKFRKIIEKATSTILNSTDNIRNFEQARTYVFTGEIEKYLSNNKLLGHLPL